MSAINITDIHALQSMIDRRAKERGLQIEFDPQAHTAYTTENTIVLPTPKLPMTKEELDLVYGYMVHETGHHTRPTAFNILRNANLEATHPINALFNVVEDGAMEQEVSSKYIGDRLALGRGMLQHVKFQIGKLATFPPSFFEDEDQVKCMAVYYAGLESRRVWDKYTDECITLYENIPPQKAQDLYTELLAEGWVTRLASKQSPEQAWDLACDLYKRLYPDADKDKVDEINKKGKENKPSTGNENEKKEGAGMPGCAEPGKGEEKEGAPEYVKYSWKDWVNSEHHNEHGIPAIINWDGRQFNDKVILLPPDKINAITCEEVPNGRLTISKTLTNEASLANAVRIYIQAQARTKIKPEQYRGKIDRRAITRLAFPPIDGGEWNKKVFQTLTNRKYKNTCIGILTDWSGSMNGGKKQIAVEATSKLAHVFDTQLRVPTLLTAFSTKGGNTCAIGIIKEFSTPTNTRSIFRRFNFFDAYTGGNADGDALLWMYTQLKKRREQRKILIVLSDGAPTDGHHRAIPDDVLKKVASAIEQDKDFTLIGIGIQSKQVQRYYKNYKVIENVNDLNKQLLLIMKETYTHD